MKANNFSNIQGYLKRKNVNIIDWRSETTQECNW